MFDHEPTDWIDLQNRVAQMFRELDCEVRVGEEHHLVRGTKEIDVWVRDTYTTPPSTYLCECKFWARAIPQEVAHSFRTVVADYGAHRGFIISKAGFQAGVYAAIAHTNTDAMTFSQLQAVFFDRWRKAMAQRFMPFADRLFPYWDYPGRTPRVPWGSAHVQKQEELVAAYAPFVRLSPGLEEDDFRWSLPITLPALDDAGDTSGTITLTTYRQLYDFIDNNKDTALRRFQLLYGEIAN